jgi:hypothetical protein
MIRPRPLALRLLTRASGARPPRPPLGLGGWSADADAIAVVIDAAGVDVADPTEVAEQIPRATELRAGTPVLVLGAAVRGRGVLRWLGMGTVPVPRAARCTALIARGYVHVGAGRDDESGADIAWGISSPC